MFSPNASGKHRGGGMVRNFSSMLAMALLAVACGATTQTTTITAEPPMTVHSGTWEDPHESWVVALDAARAGDREWSVIIVVSKQSPHYTTIREHWANAPVIAKLVVVDYDQMTQKELEAFSDSNIPTMGPRCFVFKQGVLNITSWIGSECAHIADYIGHYH